MWLIGKIYFDDIENLGFELSAHGAKFNYYTASKNKVNFFPNKRLNVIV